MRRRRRPTVNWLPVQGVQPDPNNAFGKVNGTTFALAVFGNPASGLGGINTAFLPLTFDNPPQQRFLAATNVNADLRPSLKDYLQGSAYRLRRIVGKCSAAHRSTGNAQNTSPPGVIVGAGFIVLKCDPETGDPLNVAQINEYSPLGAQNVEDPWIWRRTWHLGSGSQGDGSDTDLLLGFAPDSTRQFGSVQDGPHIDQKTARIVGLDERLFFIISTKAVALLTVYQQDSLVAGYLDWRLLGSVINRAASNRGNSSR